MQDNIISDLKERLKGKGYILQPDEAKATAYTIAKNEIVVAKVYVLPEVQGNANLDYADSIRKKELENNSENIKYIFFLLNDKWYACNIYRSLPCSDSTYVRLKSQIEVKDSLLQYIPNKGFWETTLDDVVSIVDSSGKSIEEQILHEFKCTIEEWLNNNPKSRFAERMMEFCKKKLTESIIAKEIKVSLSAFCLHGKIEDDFFKALLGECSKSTLYRFTSRSSFERMLNEGTHAMSSVVCMNDNTECDYFMKRVQGEKFSSNKNYGMSDGILFNYNYFLSSLSYCDEGDLTMWRLYGDDARGVCIVYDMKEYKRKNDFYLAEVSYQDKDGNHPELDFIKKLIDTEYTHRKLSLEHLNIWAHFFKPKEYAVEKEVRLLYDNSNGCREHKWSTCSNGIFSPVVIFDITKEEFPLKIEKCILGPNYKEKELNAELYLIKQHEEMRRTRIFPWQVHTDPHDSINKGVNTYPYILQTL